jgi:hypothetical protein
MAITVKRKDTVNQLKVSRGDFKYRKYIHNLLGWGFWPVKFWNDNRKNPYQEL